VLTIRYGQARLRAADREPDDRDGHSLLVQTFGSSFFRQGMNLMIYESSIPARGIPVLQGGGHDRWDLEVRQGSLGSARLIMGLEGHALARLLVRFRSRPRHEPERGRRGIPPCRPSS
jgi:hypothetical protein